MTSLNIHELRDTLNATGVPFSIICVEKYPQGNRLSVLNGVEYLRRNEYLWGEIVETYYKDGHLRLLVAVV